MADLDFDELFDEDELMELQQQSSVHTNSTASNRQHGGFEKMNDEEVEQFHQSQEFQDYKAEIIEATDRAPNMKGKTVQDIMGLTDRRDSVGYSYNALQHYDIDLEIYRDIVDQSPIMQATLEEGEQLLPTFKYLHEDIFLSLFKYKAVVLPETDMHIATRMNRGIIQSLINTPEYISLRQTCRMDQFNAALGTEIIGHEAIEILKEALKQLKDLEEKKKKLQELIDKEDEIDELLEENANIDELIANAQRNGNGGAVAGYIQQKEANEQAIATLKAVANKIAEECDELLEDEDVAEEIGEAVGKQFDQASTEIGQVSKIAEMWGMDEGGQSRIPFQQKKDAIEIIRKAPKLSQLTDLIGRFKESAITEQKKKAKHGATDIRSVTTGSKIEDTLPSDRINLTMEATKPDFYRRMTDNQLLVYAKESTKERNKGPIIVCVDTSGSMEGDQEIWSKAMSVGILEVAQMQKRDFACIIFSGKADNPIVIKKDEISPQKIIDVAERFHNGGTNFEAPLRKALDLIKDSTFHEADIVFITDGDCYTSDEFIRKFNQIKEDKEFKCMGVLVDCGSYSHSSDSSLKEFCDSVVRVSKIADLTDANSEVNTSIFGAL